MIALWALSHITTTHSSLYSTSMDNLLLPLNREGDRCAGELLFANDHEAFSALIAMSLRDVYTRLNDSLRVASVNWARRSATVVLSPTCSQAQLDRTTPLVCCGRLVPCFLPTCADNYLA